MDMLTLSKAQIIIIWLLGFGYGGVFAALLFLKMKGE